MKRFVVYVVCICLLFGATVIYASEGGKIQKEIENIFVRNYYQKLDSENLQKCIDVLFKEYSSKCFDTHTHYWPPKEAERVRHEIFGEYVGVGMIIGEHKKRVTVVDVLENGSAKEAGIKPGDIIVYLIVDDKKIYLEKIDIVEAYDLIVGKEGSELALIVRRNKKLLPPIKITRRATKINSIKAKMLEGRIGYIRIKSFNDSTYHDLKKALESLNGVKGFILDLRSNPGGDLYNTINSVRLFSHVKEGDWHVLVVTKSRGFFLEQAITAKAGKFSNYPAVVLVNEESASGAEIFAANLKQWGYLIIGQKTTGKGTMQTVFNLSSGGMLVLTSHEYFAGQEIKKIEGIGVLPNINVQDLQLPYDNLSLAYEIANHPYKYLDYHPSLKRAILELKKEISYSK